MGGGGDRTSLKYMILQETCELLRCCIAYTSMAKHFKLQVGVKDTSCGVDDVEISVPVARTLGE